MKCQCDQEGKLGCPESWYDAELELPYVNHKPNECRCTNDLKLYKRGGKQLWLCSICWTSNDKEVKQ